MSNKNNYTVFKLSRAKNGYILEKRDVIDGVAGEVEELVGAEGSDEHDSFQIFLYDILDNYGPSDGRYSPKRIRVHIEPGDKLDANSEEIDWEHEWILSEKEDTMTWAEYGEKIYNDLKKQLKDSKEFKKTNGYR